MTRAAVTPPSSRNAPCPCGSGQRYKDCHGALDTAAPAAPAATADALLREAQQAVLAGQLGAAKRHLDRALALAPERTDVLRERARVELRAALDEAEADLEAGHYTDYTNETLPQLADELKREGRALRDGKQS